MIWIQCHLVAFALEAADDVPNDTSLHAVWFDHDVRLLHHLQKGRGRTESSGRCDCIEGIADSAQ